MFVILEKEGVSIFLFDFVVVVDWYIHEVAAIKAKRAALFWLCEYIFPHCLCWKVSNF